MVEGEAVQVDADLITHEGRLIGIITSGRRERPAAVLALRLLKIIASARRTTLEDEVLHVVLVDGGRHFLEQVAGVRETAGRRLSHAFLVPPDDEPPTTGVALRSMGAGAGVEGATTLTSGEHSPERQEACE